MSNSLDPDQDRHSVSPDLGPNCLQRLSAEDKSGHYSKERVNQRIDPWVKVQNFQHPELSKLQS